MNLPDVATVNSMNLEEFTKVMTVLFEPSPLADYLYPLRPFKSYGILWIYKA
jgi:hypothetical protein